MEEADFIITSEEAGQRLDKILANRFQGVRSRTYFQFLIEQNKVLLNGIPVKKRVLPQIGDEIEIQFICLPELSLEPENIPLEILFEDEHLLIVNKPAGMVVHPATGNWSGTFVNALLYHCQEVQRLIDPKASKEISCRPGIVHRLDKDTTGLLLAAKTAESHEKLAALFLHREIYKEYLAVCVGNPGDVTIDLPLGRNPSNYKEVIVRKNGGKRAISHCKTLCFDGHLSVVSVELVTGRTHQIRVHLQAQGTPVLGDQVYGSVKVNKKYGVQRQLLHAYRLGFVHPFTQEYLDFRAPIPHKMAAFSKNQNIFL